MVGVPLVFAFTAGMVATFNPCGFAMVPAYVSMLLMQRPDGVSPLRQGLSIGAWVTVGFLVVFSVLGIAVTAVTYQILDFIPWLAIIVGISLVLAGTAVLAGRHIGLRALQIRFARNGSPQGSLAFGVAFGVASISCTLPIFLAVSSAALAAPNLAAGGGLFVSYGLGMGVVLMGIAVALASSRDAVVLRLRRVTPYVERIGGWLLVLSGLYIVYYWASSLASPTGDLNSPLRSPALFVERISAWFSAQIGGRPLVWLLGILAVVGLAAVFEVRRAKRGSADREREPIG
ncbi:MAG: cytochrome c biogenesis CcdA family protein [Acidimicrobiia bacterium]